MGPEPQDFDCLFCFYNLINKPILVLLVVPIGDAGLHSYRTALGSNTKLQCRDFRIIGQKFLTILSDS